MSDTHPSLASRVLADELLTCEQVAEATDAERGPLRSAFHYVRNHRAELERFLEDGRLELDNNRSERALRRIAVGRKNRLFVGSDDHGQAAAALLSVLASAKLHRLDPEAYLRDLCRVLPHWPKDRYLELAPLFWTHTRAALDPAELAREVGPLSVPPPPPTRFNASLVRDPSIFFLHGQWGGFVQLHTAIEARRHAALLKPAFDDASTRRTWLVVGYSGDSDPVFENLAGIDHFVDGLYWVVHKDGEPGKQVRERLLTPGRQAYLVRGYDAEGFFAALGKELQLGQPPMIGDPFSHVAAVLEELSGGGRPTTPQGSAHREPAPTDLPLSWLRCAKEQYLECKDASQALCGLGVRHPAGGEEQPGK